MKKQVLLKTMIVVTFIIATSFFVTCEGFLGMFQEPDGNDEYTDVEYEVTGARGNERVKSIKVYLKPDGLEAAPGPGTYGVKKSAEQRRIERALSLEGARMSHDYFEAVFSHNGTSIKRAAWEIGQPAGIAGVNRSGLTYMGVDRDITTNGVSTVFVGRKTGKTLLGVGYLTLIDGAPPGTGTGQRVVDAATESVTFTVSALSTWLGFNGPVGAVTAGALRIITNDGITTSPPTATFLVSSTSPGSISTALAGENMSPRGTGAIFPMFYLPTVKSVSPDFMAYGLYVVGGLTGATSGMTTMSALTTAVRIYGNRDASLQYPLPTATPSSMSVTNTLRGGLQWIKRTPAFMFNGLNYEINDTFIDKKTQVDVTRTGYPAADAAFPASGLPVVFEMKTTVGEASGGIFAITFQVPVYALYAARADNSGTLAPERWWIRPDYSQYQYLLDNGRDSGGAVLLGTDVQGGGDWINIYTTGIGFNNE